LPLGQSERGSHGQGGGGGSGGKGSAGGEHTFVCEDCTGRDGGNGGRGGDGGSGGYGGFGGGGSFAIWTINSSTNAEILDSYIASGTIGLGGNGASGSGSDNSLINNGRTNGGYHDGCYRDNRGGDGGYGANGGSGGRGRDGANGLSYGLVNDGIGSNPTTAIPTDPDIYVLYQNNMVICKNSVITINKSAGSEDWSLPINFDFVKYNGESVASQYSNSTLKPNIYAIDNIVGQYDLMVGSITFPHYLDISAQDRNLPEIEITDISDNVLPENTICSGGSIKVNASLTSFGN
jgi:hypothetical protein